MQDYLRQFAISAFHEDYELEASNPDEAVVGFTKRRAPETVAAVLAELDVVLNSDLSESEMCDLWIEQLGARYDPTEDGLTYREWFTHVRDLLSRPST